MHRTQVIVSLLLVGAAMMAAAPAFAIDAGQYAAGASTKLGRGVLNTVTGWGEIPMQTVIGSEQDGVLGGVGGSSKALALAWPGPWQAPLRSLHFGLQFQNSSRR